MFAYLKKHPNSEMLFDPSEPDIDMANFPREDWSLSFYDNVKKEMKQALHNDHALALEKLRDELSSSHNTVLEQSKVHAENRLESLRNDLTADAEVIWKMPVAKERV